MKQKPSNLNLFEQNEPPKSETCSPASRNSSPTPPASIDPLACPKCGGASQQSVRPLEMGGTHYCPRCSGEDGCYYFTPGVTVTPGQEIIRKAFDNVTQETLREIDKDLGINVAADVEPEQRSLIDVGEAWQEHWQDMPEFEQQNIESFDSITIHFASEADRKNFLIKMGEEPERRKSIWYPKVEYLNQSLREAPDVKVPTGKYPIYVISKGRWDERLTIKALEKLGLPFHLVVEPQESENYARHVERSKIIELPFSNLGQGSIPARNFVWDHAMTAGHKKHWILDDNMDGFYRLNQNLKMKVVNENPFTPIENFCDRYCNVALAGMQYEFFACRRSELPPFYLNTRVYSCILINHNLTQRWRGRYNEDTDLSIRVLKDGWCTVLFNAYLCKKMPTMTMKGGNTDELYAGDGRLKMAQALQEQHPDIVKITTKWGRAQHQVDYSQFRKNSLKLIKTNGL